MKIMKVFCLFFALLTTVSAKLYGNTASQEQANTPDVTTTTDNAAAGGGGEMTMARRRAGANMDRPMNMLNRDKQADRRGLMMNNMEGNRRRRRNKENKNAEFGPQLPQATTENQDESTSDVRELVLTERELGKSSSYDYDFDYYYYYHYDGKGKGKSKKSKKSKGKGSDDDYYYYYVGDYYYYYYHYDGKGKGKGKGSSHYY